MSCSHFTHSRHSSTIKMMWYFPHFDFNFFFFSFNSGIISLLSTWKTFKVLEWILKKLKRKILKSLNNFRINFFMLVRFFVIWILHLYAPSSRFLFLVRVIVILCPDRKKTELFNFCNAIILLWSWKSSLIPLGLVKHLKFLHSLQNLVSTLIHSLVSFFRFSMRKSLKMKNSWILTISKDPKQSKK